MPAPVSPPPMVHRGYPLGSLFLLVTACAVILALILPLVRGWTKLTAGDNDILVALILGGLALAFVGMLLGLFHRPRWLGAAWGLLIGCLMGIAFGLVLFIPPDEFPIVLSTALGGGLLIVLLAALLGQSAGIGAATPVPGQISSAVALAAPKKKPHPLDPDPDPDDDPGHAA